MYTIRSQPRQWNQTLKLNYIYVSKLNFSSWTFLTSHVNAMVRLPSKEYTDGLSTVWASKHFTYQFLNFIVPKVKPL